MYLLDTNVVSELRKAGDGKADPHVTAWLSQQNADHFYLSVITLMEMEIGILRVQRRDPTQGALLRKWVETMVRPEFAHRLLPVDEAVALRCARLHIPDPRAERDALIAATAMVHGMSVVTRNIADFVATGVALVNPWDGPADA